MRPVAWLSECCSRLSLHTSRGGWAGKTDEGVSWALVCFDKHEMAVRALDAAGDKKFQELVVKQLDVTKAMYSTGAMGQTLRHHFEQIDAATLKRKDARQRLSAAVDLSHHEHGEAEDASAEQVDQATRLHKWLTEVRPAELRSDFVKAFAVVQLASDVNE